MLASSHQASTTPALAGNESMPHANNTKHTPPHWPTDLEYLRSMNYSPSVPPSVLQFVQGKGTAEPSPTPTKTNVIIRRIDSITHPAQGQMGLFARKKIIPRTHIIDYIGEVHTDERAGSDYDLSLYRTGTHWQDDGGVIVNVGIDAACMGNEARFINDYRGIRPKPNALFKERRTRQGELRMSVWSGDTDVINKGDEILVSYGKAWWQARQHEEQQGL